MSDFGALDRAALDRHITHEDDPPDDEPDSRRSGYEGEQAIGGDPIFGAWANADSARDEFIADIAHVAWEPSGRLLAAAEIIGNLSAGVAEQARAAAALEGIAAALESLARLVGAFEALSVSVAGILDHVSNMDRLATQKAGEQWHG